ncbi:hypothetical protein GW17_00015916 [Ensete ventricosum]|nr:hypothetical protein GW17_00015916 [Ensete ventricosum]
MCGVGILFNSVEPSILLFSIPAPLRFPASPPQFLLIGVHRSRRHGTDLSIVRPVDRQPLRVILTLLQEVSQGADVSIDWNALVKRTATGITNAREYQMLWRHLAYHHALLEKTDDGAEPLVCSLL